jgi:uncharacterized membrane protein YebE (DUF533 family)
MNTQFFAPVLRALSASPPARSLSRVSMASILGWVGLSRASSRMPARIALLGAGAVAGAAAALLFAPESGRELRTRVGKRAGGTLGGQVGKLAGEQLGAHPVATTKVVREVRDAFSSR